MSYLFVVCCSALAGAAAYGLWYLWRKSSSDFPRPPAVSLHPKCSPMFDRSHRMQCRTRLYVSPAAMLENSCVSTLVLPYFLHGCNSSSHIRIGSGASCTPKTCSCFYPTSQLEERHPFLCPFSSFLFLSRVMWYIVLDRSRHVNI